MGISISADEAVPTPRPTTVALECDGTGCANRFTRVGDYVYVMGFAKALGWLERAGDAGRLFLCPNCSGKPRRG